MISENRLGLLQEWMILNQPYPKHAAPLKSRTPDKDKAQAQLDKAIAEYTLQKEWRVAASETVLAELSKYEATMRKTIGIRDQAKLTKEQALFVASCQSGHRDVSLNF